MSLDLTQIIIAGISTLLAGVGLKVVEKIAARTKNRQDAAAEIRNELRMQISDLRAEITDLKQELEDAQNDLDQWKAKYYELVDQLSKTRADLNIALTRIKIGFDEQTREIEDKIVSP